MAPTKNTHISQAYSAKTLDKKVHNKTSLQEELGWPAEAKRPLICLPAGMDEKLGGKILKDMLDGILTLNVEVVIVGKGSKEFGELFTELAKKHKHRFAIVPDNKESREKMYAAADMALFLQDPSKMDELKDCLTYGVVPVSPACDALEDYNPVQESGLAFIAPQTNVWGCFAALVRAVETYKFPFDWRTIQRHCMESVE